MRREHCLRQFGELDHSATGHCSRALIHVLLGIAGMLMLVGPWSKPAAADHYTESECSDLATYNTVMYQSGLSAARGVGAWDGGTSDGIWIADTDVHCIRISSLLHRLDINNGVEIGWFDDPLGTLVSSCEPAIQPSKPHGLFAIFVNNVFSCGNPDVYWSAPVWKDFRVENGPPGTDEYFTFYVNGVQQAHRYVGYNTGPIARSNGERHGLADTAWSHFKGLRYMSSAGTWFRWTESYEATGYSDDPDFRPCKVNGDDADIIVQQPAC
jgi:hypothetical protein